MRPHIIAVIAAVAIGTVLAFAAGKYRVWKYQPKAAQSIDALNDATRSLAKAAYSAGVIDGMKLANGDFTWAQFTEIRSNHFLSIDQQTQ